MGSPKVGRPKKKAEEGGGAFVSISERLKQLEMQGQSLGRLARELVQVTTEAHRLVKDYKPPETAVVHTLPHPWLTLRTPVTLSLRCLRKMKWRASLPELGLESRGMDWQKAVQGVQKKLVALYLELEKDPSQDPANWAAVRQIVMVIKPESASRTTVLQGMTEVPDLRGWLARNMPDLGRALARAWGSGARACYTGRVDCQYTFPPYQVAWREGFTAMKEYLDSGGLIACPVCRRPTAGASEGQPGSEKGQGWSRQVRTKERADGASRRESRQAHCQAEESEGMEPAGACTQGRH